MYKKLSLSQKFAVVFVVSLILSTFIVAGLYKKIEAINSNHVQNIGPPPSPTPNPINLVVSTYISPEGNKCYQYTLENNAGQSVIGVDIGLDKNTDQAELVSLPKWWSETLEEDERPVMEATNSMSMVNVIVTEGQNNIYVTTKSFLARPGETRGFSICMTNDWDATYQNSHWVAYMRDGAEIIGQLATVNQN